MKIEIRKETCIGCGRCTEICPRTFALDSDEMKAVVINNENLECANKASDQCPTDSITIQHK